MSDTINDVTIVGGGDVGLLAGLAINQMNPGIDIEVVDDFSQDIPQVGKSTYVRIYDILHSTLDIDEQRFVSEVKPIWKASVYFRDWCDREPFHFPFDNPDVFPPADVPNAVEQYYYFYDELYDSPDHPTKNEEMVAQGSSPWYFDPDNFGYDKFESFAYHLNTERFNSFLREVCRERGISLINDEIVGVDTSGDRIERVKSKSQNYRSDLFVDATGFSRVLKREQGAEFRDFNFPLDSAFNARVDRPLSEVVPATVVESGEYGWFWHIDTYDNRDLGYVYASEFVSDEQARAEFVEFCGEEVSADDVEKFEFSSGYYQRGWEENCLTIGNAGGFVEPLQSTGLTANARAATLLSNLLSAHGRVNDASVRETYNAWVSRMWESIYDFIAVHYKYSSGDTAFWEAVQSMEVSHRVERLVEDYDRNGFDANVVSPTANLTDLDDMLVFHPLNFYWMLRYLGVNSTFYEEHDFEVSEAVRREREEYYQQVRKDVENHVTVEEFYKGLMGKDGLLTN